MYYLTALSLWRALTRMYGMATPSVLGVILLLTGCCCEISRAGSSRSAELPFQPSCDVKRTELVFPQALSKGRPPFDVKIDDSQFEPESVNVTLKWRGQKWILSLFQSEVSMKTLVVYEDHHNDTVAETARRNCYYHGFLQSSTSSYAAIATCSGLAGYIQTEEELLFIEPAPTTTQAGKRWDRRPHVLYTCEARAASPKVQQNLTRTDGTPADQEMDSMPKRLRRSASKKLYLEVLVVADHTIVSMHGGKTRAINYIMTLMNIANSVYQHPTLGVDIRVVVTEIILLEKEDQKNVLIKKDAYRTVQKFCEWALYRLSPAHVIKHDVAVLLTRENLGPAGYAPITGLCNPSRSCAAITDEGFTSGFIIAHETAHIFGLFHDGHGNTCIGRQYSTSIMAPLVEAKLNHFWWSDCSKQRMNEVVKYLYCLNDNPDQTTEVRHYELESGWELANNLGVDWPLTFQCRLEFGNSYSLCSAFPTDACQMLWCSESITPHLCRTKRGPPVPGSNCGHEMQCRNSRCTYVGNEEPVHGHWADWAPWEECSAQCGNGIKRRRRSCTNPRPNYGGRDCAGDTEDWDTCVTKDCSNDVDIRAGLCAVWRDLNIRPGQHDWLPYQTKKVRDECKQTCISGQTGEVVTIDVEVSEGTPCSYDEPTNICYLGTCMKVGCDGIRNSSQTFDSCGICGGDNSQCKNVSGHYARTPKSPSEYESVMLLPKGSRHIEIEKNGSTHHFLALKNPDYGKYIVNGDKRRENSREFIAAGAHFVYTVKSGQQRFVSRGPLQGNLEVMLFPNRDMNESSVMFKYSVNKKDMTLEKRRYEWKYKDWSECSVTCDEGVTYIVHGCFDRNSGKEVEEDMCSFLDPPRRDNSRCVKEPCSKNRYTWAMTNDWGACSATGCGEQGVEIQGFKCELHNMENDTYLPADLEQCDSKFQPNYTRPCSGPRCDLPWSIGNWSQCSVTCGKGRQTRSVFCGDPTTDADDIYCKDEPPPLSMECENQLCEGTVSEEACTNKYPFCVVAIGLNLKCSSKRFRQICCKACQEQVNAAGRPQSSQRAVLRQKMHNKPK